MNNLTKLEYTENRINKSEKVLKVRVILDKFRKFWAHLENLGQDYRCLGNSRLISTTRVKLNPRGLWTNKPSNLKLRNCKNNAFRLAQVEKCTLL